MPEDMPDRMPEDMPDRMPEDLPDRMPEDLPDRMPEDMPDRMRNRMSEDMSDRMPEDINVMVGITRSKVIYFFLKVFPESNRPIQSLHAGDDSLALPCPSSRTASWRGSHARWLHALWLACTKVPGNHGKWIPNTSQNIPKVSQYIPRSHGKCRFFQQIFTA